MQLMNVLGDLSNEIGDCFFTSCFDMDSGLPVGTVSTKYSQQAEEIAVAFGSVLDIVLSAQSNARNPTVRSILGGFFEFILETDRSSFFVMVPEKKYNIAIAIGVPSSVKLGFVRLCIKKHAQNLLTSLSQIA